MSTLENAIQEIVRAEVQRQIGEEIPAIIRALGLKEAEPENSGFVDALGVAKILGLDISTPENIVKAKKHVYHLAAQKKIPSIRISDRNIKFDPVKVRQTLEAKETKAA